MPGQWGSSPEELPGPAVVVRVSWRHKGRGEGSEQGSALQTQGSRPAGRMDGIIMSLGIQPEVGFLGGRALKVFMAFSLFSHARGT